MLGKEYEILKLDGFEGPERIFCTPTEEVCCWVHFQFLEAHPNNIGRRSGLRIQYHGSLETRHL